MGKKLYVGNLAYSVRDNDLEQAFGEFGSIVSAKVMMERDTGRSKGFGFVEMGVPPVPVVAAATAAAAVVVTAVVVAAATVVAAAVAAAVVAAATAAAAVVAAATKPFPRDLALK
jgi:hypothetical protein